MDHIRSILSMLKIIMKKKIAYIFISFILLSTVLGFYFKETSYSVVINAPLGKVWDYASDSTNARDWSVYFHHISPLPGISDGKVGSLRRCFRRADETGMMWDEEVVQVDPMKYRQIRTFNIKGLSDPSLNKAEFKVHQHYEWIDPSTTKLTFSSSLLKPWTPLVVLKLAIASFEGKRIFKTNLENIKHALEYGSEYQRIHPYEATNKFD